MTEQELIRIISRWKDDASIEIPTIKRTESLGMKIVTTSRIQNGNLFIGNNDITAADTFKGRLNCANATKPMSFCCV